MIKFLFKIVFFIFLMLTVLNCTAQEEKLSLRINQMNLVDAIQLMANLIHINVIVSPKISGTVSLKLNHADLKQTFEILLLNYHLSKWRMGNVYLIAPHDELIENAEAQEKWLSRQEALLPMILRVWQIKYARAQDIARLVQDHDHAFLSKRGQIFVDVRTNSLSVQDVAIRLQKIHQFIRRLDVPVQQILIEAKLFSIDDDSERTLGMQFWAKQSTDDGSTDTGSYVNSVDTFHFVLAKLSQNTSIDVKLSALMSSGHAELISSPRLFTANQQIASIESGEEVPYQETSDSGGTAVAFKKAVLALKVIPQILPGNQVLLKLKINQDRPSNKMVGGVPTISTRQMITSVLVKAGHTIVLGGIYETNQDRGEESLPWISRIPIIGWLFQLHHQQKSRRELLIFITPKII